jgi:hypothetical protein
MKNLAVIVLLYYTAVWAIVSTLVVYVTRHLHFSAVTLGWLLSGYGLATMVATVNFVYLRVKIDVPVPDCRSRNRTYSGTTAWGKRVHADRVNSVFRTVCHRGILNVTHMDFRLGIIFDACESCLPVHILAGVKDCG